MFCRFSIENNIVVIIKHIHTYVERNLFIIIIIIYKQANRSIEIM